MSQIVVASAGLLACCSVLIGAVPNKPDCRIGPGEESSPTQTESRAGKAPKKTPFERLAAREIEPADVVPLFDEDDRELLLIMESVAGKKAEAVERLLERWDSEGTPPQARFAREVLVSWGKPADSIDAIRQAMSNQNRRTRISGCSRLARMGPRAVGAMAELEACLKDPEPVLRMFAIAAAEEAEIVAALPALKICMRPLAFNDVEKLLVSIRAARAIALLDANDTDCVKVLNEIALRCGDGDAPWSEVLRALEATGPRAIHAKAGLEHLFTIGEPLSGLTLWVQFVIGNMGENATPLLNRWLSPKLSSTALCRRTLEYLAGVSPVPNRYLQGNIDLTPLHEPVARYLRVSDEEILTLVVKSLVTLARRTSNWDRATEAELKLVATFAAATSEELRVSSAEYLGNSPAKHRSIVVTALRKFAKDESPRVRAAVANGLFNHRETPDDTTNVIELAIGVVDEIVSSKQQFDRNTEVYRDRAGNLALEVLKKAAPATEARLPKLLQFMQPRFSRRAIEAVVAIGQPAVPSLLEGLKQGSPRVRTYCARALGMISDPRTVGPLVELLSVPDSSEFVSVRESAIQALSKMPEHCEPHIPRMIRLLEHDWSREHATAVLGGLGPKARAALPVLHRQAIKQDAWNRHFTEIPESAAIYARAVALIARDTEQELTGIRRVLEEMGTGYSWRYRYGESENKGYSRTIDLIVELGPRSGPVVPMLRALLEDHELLNPVYRFEAAFALCKLRPDEPRWQRYFDRYAKHLRTRNRDHIVRTRVEQLKQE